MSTSPKHESAPIGWKGADVRKREAGLTSWGERPWSLKPGDGRLLLWLYWAHVVETGNECVVVITGKVLRKGEAQW